MPVYKVTPYYSDAIAALSEILQIDDLDPEDREMIKRMTRRLQILKSVRHNMELRKEFRSDH